MHAKGPKARKQHYVDLLKVTDKTLGYAHTAVTELTSASFSEPMKMITAQGIAENLKQIIALMQGVIDQTRRRVLDGEKVPASEKIVSIFEPHTDIIKKDRRDTFYGHKVCLSGGPSNLITDCLIVKGNRQIRP